MTNERFAFLQKKYEEKLRPKSLEELTMDGAKGSRGGGRHGNMAAGKPKDAKNTIKRLLSYLNPYKGKLFLAILCVFASTGLSLAASYILRPVVNNLVYGDDRVKKLILGCITMAVVYLLSLAVQYIQQKVMVDVSQGAILNLRNDLFDKLTGLPVKYYDNNTNGDIMSRFTNDVDAVGQMLGSTVVQLVSGVITLVGTLALMFYTNWILSLITIALLPVMMAALSAITKRSRKYYRAQQTGIGTLNGYIEETVNGQKVVKVFNHEEAAKEEFDYLNEDLRDKQIKAMFFGGIMGPVMGNLSQVSYALTAAIGGILCVARGFDVGGLTIFVNYSRQFSFPINSLAMQVNTIFAALAGAERVFAVMDSEPEEPDDEDAVTIIRNENAECEFKFSQNKYEELKTLAMEKAEGILAEDGNKALDDVEFKDGYYYKKFKGGVTIDDVTFGYVEDKTVLKNISLYANPGQKIAFVGSTGAGKTTITNLINRFYDVNEGEILIDGIPVRMIKRDDLRRNIAMVLQDTHLFTGSVKDNIRYGRLDATDEEVIEAAKTASAHSFIMRLSEGYDTLLEGDGANLSQGQRQLINIARAAISKAPILILDEATSSVDTRTEKHIEHGMDRIMASRTTLVIAHRLSTVRNSDAIMVLEHGEIIERGDHDDLLKQQGRYYELYTGKSELN